MTDIEICEKIIANGTCYGVKCRDCPLRGGEFDCKMFGGNNLTDTPEAAKAYLESKNMKKLVKDATLAEIRENTVIFVKGSKSFKLSKVDFTRWKFICLEQDGNFLMKDYTSKIEAIEDMLENYPHELFLVRKVSYE